MLHLFMVFILSHLLSDFVFQTDEVSRNKGEKIAFKKNRNCVIKNNHLICHFFIYLLTIIFLFFIISKLAPDYIPLNSAIYISSMIILASHFMIDYLMKVLGGNEFIAFLVGQSLHVLSIYLSVIIVLKKDIFSFLMIVLYDIFDLIYMDKLLLIFIIFIVGTYFSARFIQFYLKPKLPSNTTRDSEIIISEHFLLTNDKYSGVVKNRFNGEIKTNIKKIDSSSLSFGKKVGLIERALIILLTSTSNYTTIAVVIALKTLTRFKMIEQNKDFGEYYLIGNLLSLLFSIGAGIIIKTIL